MKLSLYVKDIKPTLDFGFISKKLVQDPSNSIEFNYDCYKIALLHYSNYQAIVTKFHSML